MVFNERRDFKLRVLKKEMGDDYSQQYEGQQFFSDVNTRIRDLEDKQRILKDRMVLVGESLIKEREKSFEDIQELKKVVLVLKEDIENLKDMIKRIIEKLDKTARGEDLLILQRQFDLFRDSGESPRTRSKR